MTAASGRPDITARLDELDRLHAAATPGPWFATEHKLWATPIVCEDHWPGLTEEEAAEYGEAPGPPHYVVAQTMQGGRNTADAALIVAAVNALPELVAAARRPATDAEETAVTREKALELCGLTFEVVGRYLNTMMRDAVAMEINRIVLPAALGITGDEFGRVLNSRPSPALGDVARDGDDHPAGQETRR